VAGATLFAYAGIADLKKKEIKHVVLFWLLVISFSACALLTLYTVQVQYRNFKTEARLLRDSYLANQKERLKQNVEKAVAYIAFNKKKVKDRLKTTIKSRVYEVWKVSSHLYEIYKNKRSEEEIRYLIKETLRPIRFNQGWGYFFIVSLDGTEELYPIAPELEGKNLIDLQDINGKYVIRDEITTVQKHGEGFVTGYWPNPLIEDDQGSFAYSFVKLFEKLDWFIGTAEFVDNVEQDIKRETLDWLGKLREGNGSYIFANTYQGNALLMNGKIVTEKLNLWDMQDPDGIKVVQEETRIATENPEGGFLSYTWNRDDGEGPVPVISYLKAVPEWEWVVGSFLYMDDIEKTIALKENRLKENVFKDIRLMLLGFLVSIPLITFVSIFVAKAFKRELSVFMVFFQRSKENYAELDLTNLHIKEFFTLGEVTNSMIRKWKEAERKLKHLSRTDTLTGLANRRELTERVTLEAKRMERTGDFFSFVLADIDHFKKTNDTFGHDAGDEVLKRTAGIFQESARANDVIARWGGEEFLFLLPNTQLEGAAIVAEKLRNKIENEVFIFKEQEIRTTITCGVSICSPGMDYSDAIKAADVCLYQGKDKGRNTVVAQGDGNSVSA